ncbi:sulfatase [Candidatus Halobonum tyrrellensis]|uniref:Sulfatase n=1 Tax=Candidatus Halobonum tyrrellensis G22 TaxID=1324957 RepID=V4HGF6_9EURY|nr:sulfatase [Candidatus Halobonum tyrrellensis]ESP86879.1 sulfatase [Candidatus Halobonum tyrrellensis G22]
MKPNVLFVVIDAARYDHLSVNGYDRRTTPNVDALASDGIVFDDAFAAAPWTPPSHASMFTGTYPSTHGYFDTGSGVDGAATLAETLSAHGYRTFGSSLNPKIGYDTDVARGFDDYVSTYRVPFVPRSLDEAREYVFDLLPGYARLARDYRGMDRKAGEYLTMAAVKKRLRADDERPFFGFININSPHNQYHAPRRFRERFESFDPDEVRMDVVWDLARYAGNSYMVGDLDPTEAEWRALGDWYDGEIAFADSLFSELVRILKRKGVYDETLIVVTADHGEHFGEHGRAYHQFSLFDELIHVPLVIKLPGGERAGTRTDDLVSHVDLAPTIYEALGIDVPEGVEGRSVFSGETRDAVFAEYGDPVTGIAALESNVEGEVPAEAYDELDYALQCVRTRRRKLIRRIGGEPILTRIDDEGTERVVDEAWDDEWAALDGRIDETLSEHPAETEGPEIAAGTEEQLERLGYL